MKATITSDLDLVFESLNKQVHDIIEEEVVGLHNELIDVGEDVKDTGNFKNSFTPIMKKSKWTWVIENEAHSKDGFHYAGILARGRINVGGKWMGSVAWKSGLTPMLRKTDRAIQKRTDRIKL